MDGNFAALVDGAARDLGLNDYQLSAAIGLLAGNRVYSPKQVHRLRAGEVRHPDPELVKRLIHVLRLPSDETYHAAGIWPPDLDLESYRRYRQLVTSTPRAVSPGTVALPVSSELDQLIRRNRRRGDRRHLHLVKPVAA